MVIFTTRPVNQGRTIRASILQMTLYYQPKIHGTCKMLSLMQITSCLIECRGHYWFLCVQRVKRVGVDGVHTALQVIQNITDTLIHRDVLTIQLLITIMFSSE